MNTRNRQRGCLLGLAIGDALGAAVEFQAPGSFEPVTDYRAGGPHGLDPGEWTDDTSLALALAHSIAEKGWDLDDQARRYVSWWRNGEYSVNGQCLSSCRYFALVLAGLIHGFDREDVLSLGRYDCLVARSRPPPRRVIVIMEPYCSDGQARRGIPSRSQGGRFYGLPEQQQSAEDTY